MDFSEFAVDLTINTGFSYLLSTVKNPKKKQQFRKAFLKLFNAIKAAFPNDAEFGTAVDE